MSANRTGGAPVHGLFARLAERARGGRTELEPRLGARFSPLAAGAGNPGLEVVEAEVAANEGVARPSTAPPSAGLPAGELPARGTSRPNTAGVERPAGAGFEPLSVRRSIERQRSPDDREAREELPVETWSQSASPPPASQEEDIPFATPTTPPVPAVVPRLRPTRDTIAPAGERAIATDIATPRMPTAIAETHAVPAFDVVLSADDDGIPWSLLTGAVRAAQEQSQERPPERPDLSAGEARRALTEDRSLDRARVNDGRAALAAGPSERAPETDEIHVHIGRIDVAAPPAAAPRPARSRRQPRITLSDYLGLGSSRGGRR